MLSKIFFLNVYFFVSGSEVSKTFNTCVCFFYYTTKLTYLLVLFVREVRGVQHFLNLQEKMVNFFTEKINHLLYIRSESNLTFG